MDFLVFNPVMLTGITAFDILQLVITLFKIVFFRVMDNNRSAIIAIIWIRNPFRIFVQIENAFFVASFANFAFPFIIIDHVSSLLIYLVQPFLLQNRLRRIRQGFNRSVVRNYIFKPECIRAQFALTAIEPEEFPFIEIAGAMLRGFIIDPDVNRNVFINNSYFT
jgi:hypothetical protein